VRASEEIPLRESLVHALESDKASHCFEFALRDEDEIFQMISAGQGVEGLIEGAEPGMTLEDMSEQRLAVYLRRLISLAIERQEAIGVWLTLPEPNGPKLHIEALALPTLTDAGQWRVFVRLIPTPEKRG
jgi:hypothetical protein